MTRRKRLSIFVLLTGAALLIIGGVALATHVFPDVADNDPHAPGISFAADNGIVLGYENGNFGPYDPLLRGQVATMFQRFDTYVKDLNTGTAACAGCHNDGTKLTGMKASWSFSKHAGTGGLDGEGGLFLEEGTRGACAGCHSGNGFSAMIAAGQSPNEVSAGQPNPTPQDCRACHQIHVTGTEVDWALETVAPVEFFALAGVTFDGGNGNLCANCHQPRTAFPAAVNGEVTIASSRFGPHHAPQSATLAGAGLSAEGDPSPHMGVPNTCITCHMGADDKNHLFEPNVSRCQTCHAGVEDFDIAGTQTYVTMLLDQLKPLLVAAGMLNDATEAAIPGTYPEAEAAALWDYRDVKLEDKSLGVHNPDYVIGRLQAGITAMGEVPVARP